jgi:hypothetical protein
MNYDLEQRIRTDLRSDEKLLWTGQPAQGLRLRGSDVFLIPFSLLWAGFAFFWEWSVLHQDAPGFFALWGVPFVLAGIYIVLGRFFVDAALRTRTYYALTSQRIVILSGLWTRELKSLWLRSLPELSLKEGPGTRGTIEFGSSPWPMGQWFRGTSWPGMSKHQPPSFELIEDPRSVYDLVRAAQRNATEVGA